MEDAVRISMIRSLKEKLAVCEREKSALAQELLSPFTPPKKRSEALIPRLKQKVPICCVPLKHSNRKRSNRIDRSGE
jgi:hypothetical protein